MANLEVARPSLAVRTALNFKRWIADDDHSAVLVHQLVNDGDGGEVIRLTPPNCLKISFSFIVSDVLTLLIDQHGH